MADEPETVDGLPVGHLRRARWRQRGVPPWEQREVMVGEMRDSKSRWYVQLIAQVNVPTRLYPTEVEAYAAARLAMERAGPSWTQEPAYPTEAARAKLGT